MTSGGLTGSFMPAVRWPCRRASNNRYLALLQMSFYLLDKFVSRSHGLRAGVARSLLKITVMGLKTILWCVCNYDRNRKPCTSAAGGDNPATGAERSDQANATPPLPPSSSPPPPLPSPGEAGAANSPYVLSAEEQELATRFFRWGLCCVATVASQADKHGPLQRALAAAAAEQAEAQLASQAAVASGGSFGNGGGAAADYSAALMKEIEGQRSRSSSAASATSTGTPTEAATASASWKTPSSLRSASSSASSTTAAAAAAASAASASAAEVRELVESFAVAFTVIEAHSFRAIVGKELPLLLDAVSLVIVEALHLARRNINPCVCAFNRSLNPAVLSFSCDSTCASSLMLWCACVPVERHQVLCHPPLLAAVHVFLSSDSVAPAFLDALLAFLAAHLDCLVVPAGCAGGFGAWQGGGQGGESGKADGAGVEYDGSGGGRGGRFSSTAGSPYPPLMPPATGARGVGLGCGTVGRGGRGGGGWDAGPWFDGHRSGLILELLKLSLRAVGDSPQALAPMLARHLPALVLTPLRLATTCEEPLPLLLFLRLAFRSLSPVPGSGDGGGGGGSGEGSSGDAASVAAALAPCHAATGPLLSLISDALLRLRTRGLGISAPASFVPPSLGAAAGAGHGGPWCGGLGRLSAEALGLGSGVAGSGFGDLGALASPGCAAQA